MPEPFSWYCVVEGDQLQQGDLISGCKILVTPQDLAYASEGTELSADTMTYDVVVLTQSCDLVLKKTEYVIVCPHWDLVQAKKNSPDLAKPGIADSIRKRQIPRYSILAPESSLEPKLGYRLVDFGQVFSVPLGYIAALAGKSGRRLRLIPPYCEFVAQLFASYFMRVGLPNDIKSKDLP
jgi:hypothetical protein